jgi:transposase
MCQNGRLEGLGMMDVLGIDVGKQQLHTVLLQGERAARKAVDNTLTGHRQLLAWLKNRKVRELHVCLEATGAYGEAVAEALHDAGYCVSIVNPMQIKAFGRSTMVRTKTDLVDATIIAQFCRSQAPPAWTPPPQEVRDLRALLRRRETLSGMMTAEKNRLEASSSAPVRRSITVVLKGLRREMAALEKEIEDRLNADPGMRGTVDRLDEIPGVGALSAMKILAETNDFTVCDTPRELVAYAGLNPRQYQSGSIKRRGGISKIGNAALRKALFYCALSAKNHSAYFRPFVDRLKAAGKPPKVIITALMRKILILAHTLVLTGKRFDPAYGA